MADAATTETVAETKPELFTKEDLDARVEAARRAATDEWKRKNPQFKPEERDEYETLKNERKLAEQKKLEDKGHYEQAAAAREKAIREELDAKIVEASTRADTARGRLEKALIDNALLSAATKLNAIDAQDVAALLRGRVKLDEAMDGVVVYDAAGVQAYAKGGAAMTPEQLVADFLQAKPHLVRATQTAPGGGASGGRTAATGDTSSFSDIEAKLADAKKRLAESRNNDTKAMNDVLRLSEELKQAKAGAKDE